LTLCLDEEDEDEIESEDPDSDQGASTRSASVAGGSGKMTARQAVLANVVGSSHVSLGECGPVRTSSYSYIYKPASGKKKKPLTEIELALKREETARKRKNLSEKKLEDEKVCFPVRPSKVRLLTTFLQTETINRLLKKQSRPRNKKSALSTAEDRTPAEGEVVEEIVEISQVQVVPTMYRWISTTRPGPLISVVDGEAMQTGGPAAPSMSLSFSVPLVALSQ
jgi:Ino eighty subunit 2